MQSSVLIAYATRSGSTGEVAEAIAAAMQEAGVPAEVLLVFRRRFCRFPRSHRWPVGRR